MDRLRHHKKKKIIRIRRLSDEFIRRVVFVLPRFDRVCRGGACVAGDCNHHQKKKIIKNN